MMTGRAQSLWLDDEALWYKDAIIYELHVRAFHDSDGDGIGDFRGLTEKLDYLQDLGITAIWLLPFYPSPLKDDGYDIASYADVHPSYGMLRDFKAFLREANWRGLRVINELVLNHTSDQHPWFRRARRSRPGSRWREFYVWSDTPERYRDARIIFKDFELSNWTWDPEVKAYYWHRFFSHQPDLNYDSHLVQQAVLRAVDFWLGMGVSGLRLDAVPYLYEKEGTNCENLSETHAFLKELRRHVDERFKNSLLLAEANQWPEDAAAYFGDGDECHMAFHFPLMPRLFMAIRMEDRFPIVDILQETPAIPDVCQWALFLRNHDELTLEMVTDEERDYMYRVYAHDSQARVNLGIRRRLAPLLNNDIKKIELMNSLLYSLPGTPIIYYGDEIGMGDNFYLGDRNGVRTPMQWSADRNAGFSRANPQRLYLPVIIDPEYHYEAVNVEAQQSNPDSLLWWMKRIIALRKRFRALSRGSLEFLLPENRKVLAFLRRYEDETILVVANLSRLAQHTTLNLAEFTGLVPMEVFAQADFPPIGETSYFLTLGPYDFYWFSLQQKPTPQVPIQVPSAKEETPIFAVAGQWRSLFRKQLRPAMEALLLGYIRGCRWFGGKARRIQACEIRDAVPVPYDRSVAYLTLVSIEYSEGEPETYLLPLAFASGEQANRVAAETPKAVVARLRLTGLDGDKEGVLYDALASSDFDKALLGAIGGRRHFKAGVAEVRASPTRYFRRMRGPAKTSLEPALLTAEQSNTSVVYADRLILKVFRRLQEGTNPDLEVGRFLTERVLFPHIPHVAGGIEYYPSPHAQAMTVGVLQEYVPNEGDAWKYTLDSLAHYFESVLAHPEASIPPPPDKPLTELSESDIPLIAREAAGVYLSSARLLGQRTGELHLALASKRDDPDFAPEPFTVGYQRSVFHHMRSLSTLVLLLLGQRLEALPKDAREEAMRVLGLQGDIIAKFKIALKHKAAAMRTRCHGDYHLGQVLYTGKDFVIIDFEGEPARPLGERRLKRSPLSDVAGMIRSFDYAAHAALLGQAPTVIRPEDLPILEQWARLWYVWVSAAFLTSYLAVMEESELLPSSREELTAMLDTYLLEKAVYELGYELNNRPDWVRVPLRGILQLVESAV